MTSIREWLASQGVYNVLIQVDDEIYRVGRLGFRVAKPEDAGYPAAEPPEWLEKMVREYPKPSAVRTVEGVPRYADTTEFGGSVFKTRVVTEVREIIEPNKFGKESP
jgi:hypothetical protein